MLPTPTPPSPSELAVPRVLFKGKVVLAKKTNSPFFVHQNYKKMKEEAAAKKTNTPESAASKSARSTTSTRSNNLLPNVLTGTLKYSVLAFLLSLALSRMIMEHWFWGYDGKYVQLNYYFPGPETVFTLEKLAEYDGVKDPSKPLLLAIDGNVYNMDKNKAIYGPGGTYHHFAGKDASRAFVTGCFKTGLTYDTRGFTKQQQKALAHWANFFENSPKYPKVGRVIRPSIDPASPLPQDCDPKKEGGAI
ncbi:hypothetical protein CROQUDRAFT_65321 [Cronartium quercuum f. sp. fusiforme G11]|uniref:Cytochrome b5 heme-binding domain-containing protein n=1 Tax=Cronartium quercuum f. sp. fusiforme G11 TaxID=708437 RepID=A0A9P6NDW1_9BASI|nr:hypothetical protein CROQUDRAFT_65321 [Cronartium quercuum f. sp. fusiforme G11]